MHWFWRATIAVVIGTILFEFFDVFCAIPSDVPYRPYPGTGPEFGFLWRKPPHVLVIPWNVLCRDIPSLAIVLGAYAFLTRRYNPKLLDPETRCRRCGYILKGISEPLARMRAEDMRKHWPAIWDGFVTAILSYIILHFVVSLIVPYSDAHPHSAQGLSRWYMAIGFTVVCSSVIIGVFAGVSSARQLSESEQGPHCQKCNYNLTGNTSGVCPECGERI